MKKIIEEGKERIMEKAKAAEGSDIYRDISFGVNIEGFEAYRCIGVTLWG